MKLLSLTTFLLFLALLLSAQYADKSAEHLFPVVEEGLWGFIDSTGRVVIEPQFVAAQDFREGRAPVRLQGRWGYIDSAGMVVIPATLDYALPFDGGCALVFVDGAPLLIDHDGQVLFDHPFAILHPFGHHTYTIVQGHSGGYGLIDKQGRILGDTTYSRIDEFSSGVAVVTREVMEESSDRKPRSRTEYGVIDTTGKTIIPFGRYEEIQRFTDGTTLVSHPPLNHSEKTVRRSVVNTSGEELFTLPPKGYSVGYSSRIFSEGRGRVEVDLVDRDTIKVWSSSLRYHYAGVIDLNGRLLFSDTAWDEVTLFNRGRAFVMDTHDMWFLIDRDGDRVGDRTFRDVPAAGWDASGTIFQDGMELVRTNDGWEFIDLDGESISTIPRGSGEAFRIGDLALLRKIRHDTHRTTQTYGIWDPRDSTLIEPEFEDIEREFRHGLLRVYDDGRLGYVDRAGKYVWRETPWKKGTARPLNLDYMNRGYFYASSPVIGDLGNHGGWADSKNEFIDLPDPDRSELYIHVAEKEETIWRDGVRGIPLAVVNGSSDTLYFEAQDSRLYMKVQARDQNGEWRDIEYLPSSWCGNSYHTRFLPPEAAWRFTMPVYEGEFSTELRIKLLYRRDHSDGEDLTLYSPEFAGSVNPGQFWRKREYTPAGIMDPYYN